MSRHISQDGLELIEQFEGLYLTAYHGAADRPGLLTIGYGHTDAAGPPTVTAGMKITKAKANSILASDLAFVEDTVNELVKVPLNDNQFAALCSFVFNVGEGAFKGSTLLRKLNAGDYTSVPSELMKWTKANGVRVQGLANRRAAEGGMWVKGAPVTSQYVEPDVNQETITTSLAKPETIGLVITSGGGILTSLSHLSGPLMYVVTGTIAAAAALTFYWVIKHILNRGN